MHPDYQELMNAAQAGDERALEQLFASLYAELHRLAEHNLRKAAAPVTIGATTLLHEAYLNIARREELAFPNEGSFLSYASRAMRGLVIDYARKRQALKRGGNFEVTSLDEQARAEEPNLDADQLERLSDALDRLARLDRRLAELVDLHFFCGYSFHEIAQLRNTSERTVQRDWRKARLLLHDTMLENSEGGDSADDVTEAP